MQKFILVGAVACSGLLAGCMGGMGASGGSDRAEAQMAPTQGNKVSGTVTFVPSGDKLKVFAEVSGLTPGLHGFHIERGEHHLGDMVQLVADDKGNARQVSYIEGPTLGDGPNNIIGRSVIIHAALDDYKTQPTGNSGGRQACGVIVKK